MTGLIWPTWRQHRAAYLLLLALACAAGAWAVWQHHVLVTDIRVYGETCTRNDGCHPGEEVPGGARFVQDQAHTALRWLPPVIGVFLGAPLFAQDLESGTHRLAWTQSWSRQRWIATKLATAGLVVSLGALLLTVPVTWWWHSIRAGRAGDGDTGAAWRAATPQTDWSYLPYTGPAGIAHLLLALAAGAAVGLLLRRLLPAVAVSAAVVAGLQLALDRVRPHLLPATIRRHADPATPEPLVNGWHLGQGFVRSDGSLFTTPKSIPCEGESWEEYARCQGITGSYSRDLRPSQFLPLQWMETGICLGAAALLVALCLWWVRRITTQ
ncbi:cell wall protein [Streptomyces sp. CWNU-52B]|uniref:cell wall protein n=1 Tax=unclassified Streptomyces TaxID=2593676 RepID=UPI0039BF76A3